MANDSNYNPISPMGVFPNWIFCPKIVPLVYDDSLSYYEFLNKLMVKLNEVITFANQINANVDYLRTIVERIQTLVDGFDARITANTNNISALQAAVETINGAITDINNSIDDISSRVTDVENGLEALAENVETIIADSIRPLETAITNIQITVGNHEQRIEQLEDAAFENLEISPLPFTFLMDVRNGNSKGLKIVQDDASLSSNSIVWSENKGGQTNSSLLEKQKLPNTFTLPMFKNSGNPCHLVIPSIIPYKYNGGVDFTLYFYGQRWTGATAGSNSGISYVLGVSMNSLLAEGGVQQSSATQTNMCFQDMELVVNESTGDYDLYLYNGRNGRYNAISDYTPTCIMISTVNIEPQRTGYFQRFSNLKNTCYNQMSEGLNPDGKIASAISSLRSEINSEISDINGDILEINSALGDIEDDYLSPMFFKFLSTLTPGSDVTVVNNHTRGNYAIYTDENQVQHEFVYININLTVDVDVSLVGGDFTIGTLDTLPSGWSLESNFNVEVSAQRSNSGAYGTISPNLTISGHINNCDVTDTNPVRVRVTGTVISYKDRT